MKKRKKKWMNKAKRDDTDYPPSFVLHLKRIDCDSWNKWVKKWIGKGRERERERAREKKTRENRGTTDAKWHRQINVHSYESDRLKNNWKLSNWSFFFSSWTFELLPSILFIGEIFFIRYSHCVQLSMNVHLNISQGKVFLLYRREAGKKKKSKYPSKKKIERFDHPIWSIVYDNDLIRQEIIIIAFTFNWNILIKRFSFARVFL